MPFLPPYRAGVGVWAGKPECLGGSDDDLGRAVDLLRRVLGRDEQPHAREVAGHGRILNDARLEAGTLHIVGEQERALIRSIDDRHDPAVAVDELHASAEARAQLLRTLTEPAPTPFSF